MHTFVQHAKAVLERVNKIYFSKEKIVISFYDAPKEKYILLQSMLKNRWMYFCLEKYENHDSWMLRNF